MKTSIRFLMICALAVSCGALESRADECMNADDWKAWIDTTPPAPDSFHVTGEVMLPSPGHIATLTPVPPGKNPAILTLDLAMTQEGMAAAVMTAGTARYDIEPYTGDPPYMVVTIRHGKECSVTIDVRTAN